MWSDLMVTFHTPSRLLCIVLSHQIYRINGQVVGFIKSVQNLRLVSVMNAGHVVPNAQPVVALDMFQRFINGTL